MKLNGFRPTHRNKWRMVAQQALTFEECGLLEFFIDQMDFDSRHNTYGTFNFNLQQTALILGKSKNTIRKWHKVLLKKGCIVPTNLKYVFIIQSYERYTTFKAAQTYTKEEKDQPLEWLLQHLNIDPSVIKQEAPIFEPIKAISPLDGSPKDLGSFKGKIKVASQTIDKQRVVDAVNNPRSHYPINASSSKINDKKITNEDKEWLNKQNF